MNCENYQARADYVNSSKRYCDIYVAKEFGQMSIVTIIPNTTLGRRTHAFTLECSVIYLLGIY